MCVCVCVCVSFVDPFGQVKLSLKLVTEAQFEQIMIQLQAI